jgi:hypothetical protein
VTREGLALLARYWGKADPAFAASRLSHHTMLGHSLDVAACAFVLLDRQPVLRLQFSRASGIPPPCSNRRRPHARGGEPSLPPL